MTSYLGGYDTPQPPGLPIDQQHSAHQPGATRADLTPMPQPASQPNLTEEQQ